jgi:hypothetical protein
MPMRERYAASLRPLSPLPLAPKLSCCAPTRMAPEVGSSSRWTQRSKVDLPHPLGPISTTTSPLATSRETPRTADTGP